MEISPSEVPESGTEHEHQSNLRVGSKKAGVFTYPFQAVTGWRLLLEGGLSSLAFSAFCAQVDQDTRETLKQRDRDAAIGR